MLAFVEVRIASVEHEACPSRCIDLDRKPIATRPTDIFVHAVDVLGGDAFPTGKV